MDDMKERVASFYLDEWENELKSELPACRTHSLRAHGENKEREREKNSKQGTIKFWKTSVKALKVKCQYKRILVAPSSIFKPPLSCHNRSFHFSGTCSYTSYLFTITSGDGTLVS